MNLFDRNKWQNKKVDSKNVSFVPELALLMRGDQINITAFLSPGLLLTWDVHQQPTGQRGVYTWLCGFCYISCAPVQRFPVLQGTEMLQSSLFQLCQEFQRLKVQVKKKKRSQDWFYFGSHVAKWFWLLTNFPEAEFEGVVFQGHGEVEGGVVVLRQIRPRLRFLLLKLKKGSKIPGRFFRSLGGVGWNPALAKPRTELPRFQWWEREGEYFP